LLNAFAVKLIQEGRGNRNFLKMVLFSSEIHPYKSMEVSPHHVTSLWRSSVELLTEEFYDQRMPSVKTKSCSWNPALFYYTKHCTSFIAPASYVNSVTCRGC